MGPLILVPGLMNRNAKQSHVKFVMSLVFHPIEARGSLARESTNWCVRLSHVRYTAVPRKHATLTMQHMQQPRGEADPAKFEIWNILNAEQPNNDIYNFNVLMIMLTRYLSKWIKLLHALEFFSYKGCWKYQLKHSYWSTLKPHCEAHSIESISGIPCLAEISLPTNLLRNKSKGNPSKTPAAASTTQK